MLTANEAKRLVDRVLALVHPTKGAEALVRVESARTGNTRFAVNALTTSGDIETLNVSLTVQLGQRAATASTNQTDDRALDELVGRVVRMARLAPENPETMPVLGAQRYAAIKGAADQPTVQLTPAARAKAAGAAIAAGDAGKVAMAGFLEHSHGAIALGSSAGLAAFHAATSCRMSCTARTADGTGSGWAGASSNRMADLDAAALARTAVDKATASAKPRRLEPGRYTVVLEPAAVNSLLGFFNWSLDARLADEGRSFFTKHPPGEKLFSDAITLRTDPSDAALSTLPFDSEGLPSVAARWIDKGALTGLVYSRYWAKKQGKAPTGVAGGWILDGGSASRDDLIRGVKRGVLITRFWYLRPVDPQTLLITGLTRDGVFLIEDGAIAGPVNNFRFNESPVQMLAKCDALTATSIPAAVDSDAKRVPALRTHEFNLASISEAV